MINTIGPFVFDSIKPYMLTEVNTNVRGEINNHLKTLKQTFPNSIPPLDLAIAEVRKYFRSKYDPYKLEDYKRTKGIFSLELTEIWVTGLASFYRTGDVTVTVTNNTISIGCHLSTKRLKGSCQWEVSGGGFISRSGFTSFTIEYLQVETKVNQSLNVRNTPKLQDFQMKFGNIQLRMDGLGTMDYILEFMANILPNILRYQLVDAGEGILKQRIQDFLNTIDVEKEIESRLKKIEDVIGPNNSTTFLNPPENDLYMEDLMDDLE